MFRCADYVTSLHLVTQMTGLSRGSSAESSLKRTKRKAPPPPTSPGAVAQETVPLDENVQGLALFTFVSVCQCLIKRLTSTHLEGVVG